MSDKNSLYQELSSLLDKELPSLLALYQKLHSNPEIFYLEKESSETMACELREAGFEVTRPVGKYPEHELTCYGVVAVMKNGSGPTVLVRTDMDALPVEEKTGVDYASKKRMKDAAGNEVPVMHACGHDMHQAVLVGAARTLAGMKDRWSGTLVMVCQSAEETGRGARALLADGLYGRWPVPDYGLALHVLPTLEAGQVGYCPGMAMANIDTLDITIHGVGAHGAKPHKARDPIVAAAQLITALQTIVSREIDPAETGVVTVGSIHGGTKHNIIPDKVRLELTVRSFSSEVRKTIIEAIERITIDTCRAAGMPDDKLPEVTVRKDESFVSLYNDPELVERVVKTFRALLGEDNVSKTKPSTYGEDFIEFGMTPEKVPVFMFFLGVADPGSEVSSRPDVHSPYFLPAAEHTLSTGVRAMSAAVLDLLGKG